MSIIKALQDFLMRYDGMSIVLTDRPDEVPSSYAVAAAGSGEIRQDIIGNRTYQNSYIFQAREAAANETDRQENYDFLEAFADWLEEQNDADTLSVLPGKYQAEALEVSNVMLVDLDEDGTGLYQVQLQLIFTKRRD